MDKHYVGDKGGGDGEMLELPIRNPSPHRCVTSRANGELLPEHTLPNTFQTRSTPHLFDNVLQDGRLLFVVLAGPGQVEVDERREIISRHLQLDLRNGVGKEGRGRRAE